MPKFSQASMDRLQTCCSDLQRLMIQVVQIFDITILEGHRSREKQEECFRNGTSKVHWQQSTHCTTPSRAVDIAPYPLDWDNRERFYYMAGIVRALADRQGIRVRWGGDWDNDQDFSDQTFDDLCHFELRS